MGAMLNIYAIDLKKGEGGNKVTKRSNSRVPHTM